MMVRLGAGLTGVVFGFSMSRIGFTSWDEVQGMFTFQDFRLLFAFMLAVGLLTVAWRVIAAVAKPKWSERKVHRGTLIGGALFGVGWALTGACPTIAMAQIGEGQLAALWTIAGVLGGNYIYSVVHQRYFRWDISGCLDD